VQSWDRCSELHVLGQYFVDPDDFAEDHRLYYSSRTDGLFLEFYPQESLDRVNFMWKLVRFVEENTPNISLSLEILIAAIPDILKPFRRRMYLRKIFRLLEGHIRNSDVFRFATFVHHRFCLGASPLESVARCRALDCESVGRRDLGSSLFLGND
jgi:hypothetical protein